MIEVHPPEHLKQKQPNMKPTHIHESEHELLAARIAQQHPEMTQEERDRLLAHAACLHPRKQVESSFRSIVRSTGPSGIVQIALQVLAILLIVLVLLRVR